MVKIKINEHTCNIQMSGNAQQACIEFEYAIREVYKGLMKKAPALGILFKEMVTDPNSSIWEVEEHE